jgi:IclR family transcriptional regulator, KDG regulon repressor
MERTLLKGLRVLSAIAESDEPRGASELARELGLTRSNAHRLVQTLAAAGFVKPVGNEGKYTATLLLFELGARVSRRLDVWSVSYPVMSRLARLCEENVILATLERGEMVVLERIEATRALRTYTPIGTRTPLHCSSPGKVYLAFGDVAVVGQLEPFTARTITDPARLARELQKTRDRGYSIARGEWRDDVGGLAVPLRGRDGRVIAALSISGPMDRFRPKDIERHAPHLLRAGREISIELGWRET